MTICTRCVMDTSDPNITFDEKGVCNHCRQYDRIQETKYYTGGKSLEEIVANIKVAGLYNQYDCVIGISGGVDSTYTAYLVKQQGLRPLGVHLDNGWDDPIATENAKRALKILNIPVIDIVLNPDEFRSLQMAFLLSGTTDGEVPTDHAITAALFEVAAQNNIQYILTGNNTATESVGPLAWSYGSRDWKYIEAVHKAYDKRMKLTSFPHYSLAKYIWYTQIKGIKVLRILNFIDYKKDEAKDILRREFGWKDYGYKHFESIYTRWYNAHYLPKKWGIDKRRAHHAALVMSGQMTRGDALKALESPPYASKELEQKDRDYTVQKLGIDNRCLDGIMKIPNRTFRDFPNNYNLIHNLMRIRNIIQSRDIA